MLSVLMVASSQVLIYYAFNKKLIEHELENGRNDMIHYLNVLDLLEYQAFDEARETLHTFEGKHSPTDYSVLQNLKERYHLENYVVFNKENMLIASNHPVSKELMARYRAIQLTYRDVTFKKWQTINLGMHLSAENRKIMMSILRYSGDDPNTYIYQFSLTQMMLSSVPSDIYQNIYSALMRKRVAMENIVITRQKKFLFDVLENEMPTLSKRQRQELVTSPYIKINENGELKTISLQTIERSNWLVPINVLLVNSYRNNAILSNYILVNSFVGILFIIFCAGFAYLGYKALKNELLDRLDLLHDGLHKTIDANYEVALESKGKDVISEITKDIEHIRSAILERLAFISEMSFYDTVTGIGNIYLLEERLIKLYDTINPRVQYVLVIIEIKNIKALFEVYGAGKMNFVYATLIAELHSVFGRGAIYRKSDYTFAAIYESRPPNHIEEKIKEMRIRFREINLELAIEPRFVIAAFPEHGKTPKDLLKNIDIAQQMLLHQDVVYYSQKIKDEYLNRVLLENELKKALERHEISVAYQPIVCPCTNVMKGVEALVRWYPSSGKHIMPDIFIPVAEQIGMIHLLDKFVFEKAISMLQVWSDIYPHDFFVSINCSPKWFMDPEFILFVEKILDQYAVNPQQICIEIIETCLIEDIDAANDILLSLKKMGIKMALDDFGKGYSSLNYLRKLHIDKLKIDKDFLQEMTFESGEHNLIESIIAMARQMNLQVVVEGVEEKSQAEYLEALEVELIQGYYYSKPVKKQVISDILLNSANMRLVD